MELKGTWTTKEPPKTLQTILGLVLLLVILAIGLWPRGPNAARTARNAAPTPTVAASGTPVPHR